MKRRGQPPVKPIDSLGRNVRAGFSLVEISIVLAILSVVLTGLLPFILDANRKAEEDTTRERMARVESAFLAYYKANTALPCPASASEVASSSNFGEMANYVTGTPGTCIDSSEPDATSETSSSSEVAFGMVPVRNLGLADEMAFDGFGRRFSYFVSLNTVKDGSAGEITVQDLNASSKYTDGAFALMSHGANGHGGYTLSGSRKNAANTNTAEQENCDCSSAAVAGAADAIIAQGLPAGEGRARFDDIVSVYTVPMMDALTN